MVNRFFTGWFAISLLGLALVCFTGEQPPASGYAAAVSTTEEGRLAPKPVRQLEPEDRPHFVRAPQEPAHEAHPPEDSSQIEAPPHGPTVVQPANGRFCWPFLSPVVISVPCANWTSAGSREPQFPEKAVQAAECSDHGERHDFEASVPGGLRSQEIERVDAAVFPRGASQ